MMDRRLAVVAAAFAVVVAGSALVFDDGLGLTLINAFYFTVTTVTSVALRGSCNLK